MDEYIAWFWDVSFWHWFAFGLALLGIEIIVPTTLFIFPAISAALVGGVVMLAPEMDWRYQILLFAVLAVVSSIAWRMVHRNKPIETDHPNLNDRTSQYIGRQVTLTEPLQNGRGRVQLDDSHWQAKTGSGETLEAGVTVKIVGADSATLIVEPS